MNYNRPRPTPVPLPECFDVEAITPANLPLFTQMAA